MKDSSPISMLPFLPLGPYPIYAVYCSQCDLFSHLVNVLSFGLYQGLRSELSSAKNGMSDNFLPFPKDNAS